MKTYSAKAQEVPRKWWVIDANNQVLGQVAVKAANLLRGKEKAIFTPHVDTGDFVIVINAEKALLTGRKEEQKIYYRQSGRPGGLKAEAARHLRQRRPVKLIEEAVRGMLPKNTLGKQQGKKLKVYAGAEHPHQAQKPAEIPAAALRA